MTGGILKAGERVCVEADESTLKESGDCFDGYSGNNVELMDVREHGEKEGVSDDDGFLDREAL